MRTPIQAPCSQQIPEKKFRGSRAPLREKENLFRYRAQFEENLLPFVRARAHVRALMTRKLCAVRMRNAILWNYLNQRIRMVCGINFLIFRHLSGTCQRVSVRKICDKKNHGAYVLKTQNTELHTLILRIFKLDIFHVNVNSAGLQEQTDSNCT